MAEGEGKKEEEEKKDLDSSGQVRGYISLDQAWVLAMRHARDNPDVYGPKIPKHRRRHPTYQPGRNRGLLRDKTFFPTRRKLPAIQCGASALDRRRVTQI